MTSMGTNHKAINHIGLSVPDLERAVDWYQTVLGFKVLMGPYEVTLTDSYASRMLKNFFGPELKKLRMVHMSMGNDIGLEMFEFIEPQSKPPKKRFNYTTPGFYHICVTDTNIESLVNKILEHGGTQISQIWEIFKGSGLKAVYCQDPFGNVIEVFSHPYHEVWTNRKQEEKKSEGKSHGQGI
jgi:catechol-2,3-dioxygenase